MPGRLKKKPQYNPELQFNDFLEELSNAYEETSSLRILATELNISPLKLRKLLITADVFTSDICTEINNLYQSGKKIPEIMKLTGLSRASVHSYLPYTKGLYNAAELSLNAERCRAYRIRQKQVQILQEMPSEENLWQAIIVFQDYPFKTATGLPFRYKLKVGKNGEWNRELLIDRREKSTGNPYIKEKMDLDVQVSKLKLLKANHTSQIYRLESDIAKNFPVQISALKERIAGMQVDSQVVKSVDLQDNDTFAMTVGNVLYEDKKEAGEALIAACAGLKAVSTGGKVGEYHGFTLSASYNMFSNAFELTIKGKCSYKLEIGKDPIGNMQRIHNTLFSIDRKLTESEQKLETVQQQLATAQEEVKKPFPKEAELNEKMERLSELNALLNMDEKGNETILADEDIGREESSVDSRGAVEEKELLETADRIHKPSILERLKQEKAQQNTAEQTATQKSAKKKHEQEL